MRPEAQASSWLYCSILKRLWPTSVQGACVNSGLVYIEVPTKSGDDKLKTLKIIIAEFFGKHLLAFRFVIVHSWSKRGLLLAYRPIVR